MGYIWNDSRKGSGCSNWHWVQLVIHPWTDIKSIQNYSKVILQLLIFFKKYRILLENNSPFFQGMPVTKNRRTLSSFPGVYTDSLGRLFVEVFKLLGSAPQSEAAPSGYVKIAIENGHL